MKCARERPVGAAIKLPAELPISRHAGEIESLLAAHQVIIVAGDTGSGKTTQLPKICLRAGLAEGGMIGHTQPRRLAAMSVAARIAAEVGVERGAGVGVQVRFDQRVPAKAWLKLMTDGILLTEIQRDRLLRKYRVLILDEAHERSLNIDFLLGYLKTILPRRKNLKLIITSATLDVERIAALFGQAPIVRVAGRTYPVAVRYRPPSQLVPDAAEEEQQMAAIERALGELAELGGGDALVFLSSEKEIRETAAYLRKRRLPNTEILPLYSRLRAAEQKRIFAPHRGRRIVLATNVAETSLTVPGIHYVVDTGFARISRYSVRRKLLRLPVEPISRASAEQRKGRCGRLAEGVCIRLYSEREFAARPEFTDPEIQRSNLASVILRMSALRLGRPEDFPFLDAPERKSINDGRRLLRELGATDATDALTRVGRKLAELPLDPQYGRMLVTASDLGSLREMLIIVSALSLGDLRESAMGAADDEKWNEFADSDSDFLGLLKLWSRCESERLPQSRLRKFCARYGLTFQRVREWREIHRQLRTACLRLGLKMNQTQAGYAAIHRALTSGSLNQVARHHEGRVYLGSRNRKLGLAPSSSLARKKSTWIVTSEWIETARTFASMAARIKPQWVIEFAGEMLRMSYGEPYWSQKRQQVMVDQTILLHGLVLREGVAVDFARLDQAAAREVFLEQALVCDQIDSKAECLRRNRSFLATLRKQEEKFRRPQLVVNEREMFHFYERRLPDSIGSTAAFDHWLAEDPKARNQALDMKQAGLFRTEAFADLRRQFPDRVNVQNNVLPVDYAFEPGARGDGPSLRVPAELLAQLTRADLDWAVPGLIREKCIALIRALPKRKRRNFVPIADFVDRALPRMRRADGELIDSLLARMNQTGAGRVRREDLLAAELPQHLRTRLQVLDPRQRVLAEGDDLAELRKRFAGRASPPRPHSHPLEREGMRDWEVGDLPESLLVGDDVRLVRYPALVDKGDSVAIVLLDNRLQADAQTRHGLLRLFLLRTAARRNALRKQFLRFRNANAGRIALTKGLQEVERDAVVACYREAFGLGPGLDSNAGPDRRIPRSKPAFEERLREGSSRLPALAGELEQLLERILRQVWDIRRALSELAAKAGQGAGARADMQKQLEHLFVPNMLRETDMEWLRQFPRYLQGIALRLEKAPFFGPSDEQNTREVAYYWDRFEQLRQSQGNSPALQNLRWSLEEFRVSLFCQRLGTKFPISRKRLDKLLASPK